MKESIFHSFVLTKTLTAIPNVIMLQLLIIPRWEVLLMYNDFYALSFNPFDKSISEKDSFLSKDFQEMTHRLEYLKDIRGIGVFTARPGMGKSYCLRCFSKKLNPNLYQVAYICLSTISVAEFYKQFCSILGVSDKGGKTGMFKAIQDQIYYQYKEKRQPLLLIIDEAQYLSTGILNDIKMLMNYGYDSVNCFTLILCGESHLNDILRKPVHEALRQRITVHYNYSGLDDKEVASYILYKLERAGGSKAIIDDSALASIHGYSQGNPRLIDNLMTDALAFGSQAGKQTIDSDIILAAVDNQNLT
jgi:general secretion pathway protein A